MTLMIALLASMSCSASDGVVVGGGRDEALRLWKAGISAVISGEDRMAESLWIRCLKAEPENQDCRVGLILLGHQELRVAKPEAPKPQVEGGLKEGARAVISGQQDKGAALKNWKAGALFYQRGEYRKAHDAWARCLELDPSNQECADGVERVAQTGEVRVRPKAGAQEAGAYYEEGMQHFMGKRLQEARQAWERCLKVEPGNEDCRKGLKKLETGR
ncbi:MAG: hypothetical protein WC728_03055 [Elusimicrobiota bacterium]